MSIKEWFKNLKNLSIVKKQVLSYVLPILFAVILLGGYSFIKTKSFTQQQAEDHMDSVIAQVKSNLDYKIRQYNRSLEMLYLNNKFQDILFKEYYTNIESGRETQRLLTYLAPLKATFKEIEAVNIYTENSTILPVKNYIGGIEGVTDEDWYKIMEHQYDQTKWMITNQTVFINGQETLTEKLSMIRKLRAYSISSFDANFLGFIKIDFDIQSFFQNIDQLGGGWNEWINILDDQGNLLYMGMPKENTGLLEKLSEKIKSESTNNLLTYDGKSYLVKFTTTEANGWQICYVISMETYAGKFSHLYMELGIILLIFFVLSLMLSIYLANKLTNRIRNLEAAVAQVKKGDLSIVLEVENEDEVGRLTVGFNSMVKEIDFLIHQVYQFKIKEKEYDLQALQAQLNPHFLYNTLSAISWMGRRHKIKEIPEISEALARFYRLTLNKGHNIISIAEEIDQAKAYLEIKKIRYRERLSYHFDIDTRVNDLKTIKLILQPFIENAIIHGMYNEDRILTIVVKAIYNEAFVEISIIDDGMGMQKDDLKALIQEEGKERKGYGITNVDKRIKMYFGESCGVSIFSQFGIGTSVTIKIPCILSEGDITNYQNNPNESGKL